MPILLPTHNPSKNNMTAFSQENDKRRLLNYWTQTSGVGTLAYNSTDGTEGVGRFTVTGNGTWVLNFDIPIAEYRGLACMISHQQLSGSSTVFLGVACKTSAGALLSNRFFVNAVAAPTTATSITNYIINAGLATNNYPSGTRLATFILTVQSNTGTYSFDRPYLDFMSIAQRALYV